MAWCSKRWTTWLGSPTLLTHPPGSVQAEASPVKPALTPKQDRGSQRTYAGVVTHREPHAGERRNCHHTQEGTWNGQPEKKTLYFTAMYKNCRCTPTERTETNQESLGSPNSFTVPASRLLSYLPSLSSQANASRGLLGCHATVKVGDSHCTSHSLSPVSTSAMSIK